MSDVLKARAAELSRLSPWRSSAAIAFDWLAIFALAAAGFFSDLLIVKILAVVLIAGRQHGLLLLMHEGAHVRLAKNRALNDWISDLFCAFPFLAGTAKYREFHLPHHQFLFTDKDPETPMHRARGWEYPQSRRRLWGRLLAPLVGGRMREMIGKIRFYNFAPSSRGQVAAKAVFWLAVLVPVAVFGLWSAFALYWLLPMFTVLPVLLTLRNMAEHWGLPRDHELNSTRTVTAGFIEGLLLVPHNGGYHLDHHLHPGVPFYNLRALHRALREDGVYRAKAALTDSYVMGRKPLLGELSGSRSSS